MKTGRFLGCVVVVCTGPCVVVLQVPVPYRRHEWYVCQAVNDRAQGKARSLQWDM